MQPINQTANVLADNEAPYTKNDFSVIMELTKEEKRELLNLWKERKRKVG